MKAQNVHEYTNEQGEMRWAVGVWDQNAGQYTCPLDAETRKLTGCYAEFSREVDGMGSYEAKRAACRHALTLYGYVKTR